MKTKTILGIVGGLAMILIARQGMTQKVSIGAKAGMAMAYFSNVDKEENWKRLPHLGITGGFVSDFRLSRNFSIQLELLYSQRGMKLTYKYQNMESSSDLFMNVIQLPVLLKFTLPAGKFRFYLNTGVNPSVAINGKDKVTYKNAAGEKTTDKENLKFGKDNWQQYDISIPVGGGFGFKLGPGCLYLDLRYNIGLIDVANVTDKPKDYQAHFNRNGEVAIGYLIPLGKKSN